MVPGAFLSEEDCRRREEEKTKLCDVSNWDGRKVWRLGTWSVLHREGEEKEIKC